GDDPNAFGRLNVGRVDRLELEHDGLLPAHRDEAAALEERPRLDVALLHFPLDLVPAEVARPGTDLGEESGADPGAPARGNHRHIALREGSQRFDEPTRDRLVAETPDQIREVGVRV